MNWNHRFAACTGHMKRTAVRELLKLTSQPGMISFAGGLPATELFPLEAVQRAAATILDREGSRCVQYGESEGLSELRDWIARRHSSEHVQWNRNNVLITNGAQQALDLIGRVLLDPGDCVIVENPTYLALLSAWRPLGVEFLPANCDNEGLQTDSLNDLLSHRPKLIYTQPNFQNPRGTTFSMQRRLDLANWLRQTDVALIEDDPYGELRYDDTPLPSICTLDAATRDKDGSSQVAYVGTYSKTLMPGLRVGWVLGPTVLIDKLVQAKQSTDLHTSTFNQYLVLELVRDGFLEPHIEILREEYRKRRDTMVSALEWHLPGLASWQKPAGGIFLLVTLPEGLNGRAILEKSLKEQVAFVPGEEFHLNGEGSRTIRLNFSNVSPSRIEEGIRRLRKVIENLIVNSPSPSSTHTAAS